MRATYIRYRGITLWPTIVLLFGQPLYFCLRLRGQAPRPRTYLVLLLLIAKYQPLYRRNTKHQPSYRRNTKHQPLYRRNTKHQPLYRRLLHLHLFLGVRQRAPQVTRALIICTTEVQYIRVALLARPFLIDGGPLKNHPISTVVPLKMPSMFYKTCGYISTCRPWDCSSFVKKKKKISTVFSVRSEKKAANPIVRSLRKCACHPYAYCTCSARHQVQIPASELNTC